MKVFITAPSIEAYSNYWKREKLDPNKVFYCEDENKMAYELGLLWDKDIKAKGVVVNDMGHAIRFHDLEQDLD
jgi:hypothetical protein